MKLKARGAALLLLSLIALTASTCKQPQTNSNQQSPGATEKTGRWIAQYRSPASAAYLGANLAVFSYSAISVVSSSIVYACGDIPAGKSGEDRVGVILKTTDGGQHWSETPVELPGVKIPTLNAIQFMTPDVGWAVGADSGRAGVVLKTTDGGATWTRSSIPHKEIPTTVCFVDSSTGWIGGATPLPDEDEGSGGPSAILWTGDGGATWQPQYNVPISIHRIFFVDQTTGWASGSKGAIYHTTDGGRTWATQRTEIEVPDGPAQLTTEAAKQFVIRGLFFTDKDHGFAAAGAAEGGSGRVISTLNGGETWRRTWMVVGSGVHDVLFVNANEGWALMDSDQYVYHTLDGGRSWVSEPKQFEQNVALNRLGASDADHVWAAGGGAIFVRVKE